MITEKQNNHPNFFICCRLRLPTHVCSVKHTKSSALQGKRVKSLPIVQQWSLMPQDMAASCITCWCCCLYHCLVASVSVSEQQSVTQHFLRTVNWVCLPSVNHSPPPRFVSLLCQVNAQGVNSFSLGHTLLPCCRDLDSRPFSVMSPGHQQSKNIPKHKFHRAQQLSSFVSSDVRNNKNRLTKVYLT